jgi:hypothetical protein
MIAHIPGLFEMYLMTVDVTPFLVLMALGTLICISSAAVFMAAFAIARTKVRKEIGLYKTHIKYHPKRPDKKLHF